MTTMADLVSDARRIAYGSMADQLNFLTADAPIGATELSLLIDVAPLVPGTILSCGLNVWYVIGNSPAEKKVTVHPGYDNSHTDAVPSGTPVMIRPRVTDWLLFGNLNDVIRQMSSSTNGLYSLGEWTDVVDPAWQTYAVPVAAQGMTDLIKAQIRVPGSTDVWIDLPANTVRWQPEANTIQLTRNYTSGTDVKFVYRAGFQQATSLTDDVVVDLGLAETMIDIPPLGAAVALLRTTESRRAQIHAQGDSRRAEEVVQGFNSNAARELDRDFKGRIADEYIRLINRYPIQREI